MPDYSKKTNSEEINELREQKSSTLRVVSPELEKILYTELKALDHGFIRVIDYMGNDSSVVQAARVSYGAGTKKTSDDARLIDYLLKNKHTTPFEMCEIKFHIKMPMFVARQWLRHRTANVNEYSARYSVMNNEFYIPLPENIATQSQTNKQGREENILSEKEIESILEILNKDSSECYKNYQTLMNCDADNNIIDENKKGLTRELARMNLPVNIYTECYWKIDLHNLLHFLKLRTDKHAQYEIRVYANIILDIVKKWVPATYDAFVEYHLESKSFSKSALEVIRRLVKGEKVKIEDTSLSKREWNEIMQIIELKE